MKYRIAFLSLLFLFLAGVAMATPASGEAPAPDDAMLAAAWDLEPVAAPDNGYALAPHAGVEEPTELAVYWPCGCTPRPGCPFPVPWPVPDGPTIFNPFPSPDPCGPCPY